MQTTPSMHYVSLAGFSASPWSESFGRGARRTASAWSRRCRVRRCRCAHATGTCHRRSMRPTRVQRRRSGHSGGERGSVRHGITASVPRARAGGTAIRDALHGLGGPARARSLDGSGADLGRGCGGGSSGSSGLACLDRLGVDPVAAKREQAGKGRDGGSRAVRRARSCAAIQGGPCVLRDPRWAVSAPGAPYWILGVALAAVALACLRTLPAVLVPALSLSVESSGRNFFGR